VIGPDVDEGPPRIPGGQGSKPSSCSTSPNAPSPLPSSPTSERSPICGSACAPGSLPSTPTRDSGSPRQESHSSTAPRTRKRWAARRSLGGSTKPAAICLPSVPDEWRVLTSRQVLDRWAGQSSYSARTLVAYWEWVQDVNRDGPPDDAAQGPPAAHGRDRPATGHRQADGTPSELATVRTRRHANTPRRPAGRGLAGPKQHPRPPPARLPLGCAPTADPEGAKSRSASSPAHAVNATTPPYAPRAGAPGRSSCEDFLY
jgi:hypothetical protein